eukprot:scaffold34442_cov19-Tisochrysis_lutea.AAC.4
MASMPADENKENHIHSLHAAIPLCKQPTLVLYPSNTLASRCSNVCAEDFPVILAFTGNYSPP